MVCLLTVRVVGFGSPGFSLTIGVQGFLGCFAFLRLQSLERLVFTNVHVNTIRSIFPVLPLSCNMTTTVLLPQHSNKQELDKDVHYLHVDFVYFWNA